MTIKLAPHELVQLIQVIAKARKHLPNNAKQTYPGTTWFSERDRWMYLESEHQNMCDTCHNYNQDIFRGDQLLKEFPWCSVIDDNYVSPHVHPNCHCGAVRLFSLDPSATEYVEVIQDIQHDEVMIYNTEGRSPDGYQPRTIERVLIDQDRNELHRLVGYEQFDKTVDVRVEVLAKMNNSDLSVDAIEKLLAEPKDNMQAMLEGMTYVGYIAPVLMQELLLYRLYRETTKNPVDWLIWRKQYRSIKYNRR